MRWFLQFCRLRFDRLPWSPTVLDRAAAQFLEYLWEEGESRQVAADLLSGLSGRLYLKCFTQSWKLYATWLKRQRPFRCLPILEIQLEAFAGYWIFAKRDPRFGALLMIGFHFFLRTTELLMLLRSDVRFDLASGNVLISLRLTGAGPATS